MNYRKKAILMAGALLCLNLSLYSQSISLKMRNVTVRKAMTELQAKSGYSFVYIAGDVDTGRTVSVDASQLKDAVAQILKGQNVSYEIQGKNIVVKKSNQRQTSTVKKKVSGTVKDVNGDPIIGATVMEGGTTNGTITDFDGNFVLEVTDGAELDISYIGYQTQKLKTQSGKLLAVTLKEDLETLDEVVVVGYGTQKKVSVTGAMASTKGSDLAKVPTANITNTLAGRLPGLISYNRSGEPGYDDAGLLIRGASTTGDSSPLIVVDGVADRAGSLGRLDPNDIENITILKDASAAIYGSRAANGVILVTTKRAKSEKFTVSYNGNVGISSPTILPDMCDSWQYAELINEITPGTYSDEAIQKFKDGSDPVNYPNVNAFDILLKQAVQTQHNISASAGGKYVSFYASLGYKYQDNYYKNSASNYSQYNFRTNIDFTPHKDVKIGLNVAFRQEDRNSPITGSEDIWRYLIKYNPMVNIWFPGTNYGNVSSKQDNFSPATGLDGTTGYQRDRQSYLNADLTLHWDLPWITEGLSIDAGLYVDRADVFYKKFEKKYYMYEQSGDEYIAKEQGSNILDQNMNQTLGVTMNARLNYKRTFNDVHNLNVFVAYEQYQSRYDYMQARRQDFISTAIDEIFAGDINSATNDGKASETARMNYFGRLDYDYAGKYLFQFNWRYDGSENFPAGKRFGFFPGVSVGWRVSEEKFWKENVSWMDYLKVRASWGQMGNDKVDAFQYLTAYTFDNPAILGGGIESGLWLLRTANPNITWEVANTYNVGIETRFLKYFNFEADFFKTKRNNILATRNAAIPEYAGLTLPDENIGVCSNIGTELTLGFSKQLNKDWTIMASGNFTYNHSTIDFIDEPESTLPWQKRTGLSIGTDGDMYLMYEADGIFRTQEELDSYPHLAEARVGDVRFKDVNGDKVIDGNDKVRQDKPAIPRIMYGINLGANYRNWSLSMLFQGAAQVWQYTFMEAGTIGNFTKDFYENRWTEDNINAEYPRTYNRDATVTGGGNYRNTFWLNNASYLRLKSIELAYDLPKSWLKNTPISAVRLSLSGYNLFTITGIRNIDPETQENSQGWAAWNTPQSKVYNFGINVTF
ncbi:TonB-dependent receptor [Bacteroides mediterraneensis]|uniref:TonB-dependent receptor n=1 Tax=Bacteroides mediterraneensis TaxID=1841856 RepID=UPI0026EFE33E|nr:TonB-dependent receptor [Bacteroides mediterraneensis]